MAQVEVTIEGVAPLLFNKWAEEEKTDARKNKQYIPEEEAEKSVYRDPDIGIYAPASWIKAACREASKEFKRGRGTMTATVKSCLFVAPVKIPFGREYDEIDRQAAVVQKARIMRNRAKFNTWALTFNMEFDPDRIPEETLREILIEAGKMKGIGDYRPDHGRFKVTSFEKVNGST